MYLWSLAILVGRNPPEWSENGVFHATRPPWGDLYEIENPHFQASTGVLGPGEMAKPLYFYLGRNRGKP